MDGSQATTALKYVEEYKLLFYFWENPFNMQLKFFSSIDWNISCDLRREYQLLPIEWLNQIWRPDSYFKNAKKVTFQTMTIPNHYVWLYRTKKIFYMVK